MRKRVVPAVLAVGAIVAGLGAAYWSATPDKPMAPAANPAPAQVAPVPVAPYSAPAPASVPPASTTDTAAPVPALTLTTDDVARLLPIDAAGNLVLGHETPAALQVLLAEIAATGGKNPDRFSDLAAIVRAALPAEAAQQAVELLASFERYQRELEQETLASKPPQSIEDLEAALARQSALRVRHLGKAVADALYGHEEAASRYNIEVMRVQSDATLDAAAKARKLESLRKEHAAALEATAAPADAATLALTQQVEELRRQGVGEQTIQAIRTQQLGYEAAEQLSESERIAADWERRYREFRRQKDEVMRAGLADADKEAQIEQLLRQYFSEQELAAARAYDRSHQ